VEDDMMRKGGSNRCASTPARAGYCPGTASWLVRRATVADVEWIATVVDPRGEACAGLGFGAPLHGAANAGSLLRDYPDALVLLRAGRPVALCGWSAMPPEGVRAETVELRLLLLVVDDGDPNLQSGLDHLIAATGLGYTADSDPRAN
jgi:hypothetical protein